jgi:hypothetical protein
LVKVVSLLINVIKKVRLNCKYLTGHVSTGALFLIALTTGAKNAQRQSNVGGYTGEGGRQNGMTWVYETDFSTALLRRRSTEISELYFCCEF